MSSISRIDWRRAFEAAWVLVMTSAAPSWGNPPIPGEWWGQATQALAAKEYEASRIEAGLQAPNRAQNLRVFFRDSGVEVVPRTGRTGEESVGEVSEAGADWNWGWRTLAWGREGRMRHVRSRTPAARGTRVEYVRDALIEWYENRPAALEQGFTLLRAPAGEGPLFIRGHMQSTLRSREAEEGGAIEFMDPRGRVVLRYGGLRVMDAAGEELPSRIVVEPASIALQVDDRDALYPIVVDPGICSPAWIAEGDQDAGHFGYSVATAGDVNADGYSDVIVGAAHFDGGRVDEGAVFAFYGSADGLPDHYDWWARDSDQDNAFFGCSVASAGDINADGFDDVIVGAWGFDIDEPPLGLPGDDGGAVFLYLGGEDGLEIVPSWSGQSDWPWGHLGISVSGVGDVDGDGYDDVVAGAHRYENDGPMRAGAAFVYRGTEGGTLDRYRVLREFGDYPYDDAEIGISVSGGDLNGDCFADVIVGASRYDGDVVDEGAVVVYWGGDWSGGISRTIIEDGNQADSFFGYSVAAAGDVNGDRKGDLLVGAIRWDDALVDEGKVFVYGGSAAGVEGAPLWSRSGGQESALFGYSIATAGDVNGDGYADIVIGTPHYDFDDSEEGGMFVYYGSEDGPGADPVCTAEGGQTDSWFGSTVASAGDVNGDGYGDIIAGAPYYDLPGMPGQDSEGRALVYLGAPYSLAFDAGWIGSPSPTQLDPQSGYSLAMAGDVNGDGYGDAIVGAPFHDGLYPDEGRAWMYEGTPSGFAPTPSWSVGGNQAAARFGQAVAPAGDVNGDGYADVIVGAPFYSNGQTAEGRAYIFAGSSGGLSTTPTWIGEMNQAAAEFGASVASAGDVNGDGWGDVIVGAPRGDNGQTDEGGAFLYLGSPTGPAPVPSWIAEGNQANARFGHAVASAGDANGDGYSDVIVGAPLYDNGQTDEGKVLGYLGSATGLSSNPSWVFEGNQSGARAGHAVAHAGDVNGDGFGDVIVGAPFHDAGQQDEGRAYVFLGTTAGLSPFPAWMAEGNQPAAYFGQAVATAGDVNGDAWSDVLVGAPSFDGDLADEGFAFCFLGSAAGPAPTPAWIGQGDQAAAQFGYSLDGAADANGDGFGDILAGAPLFDDPAPNTGRSFLYFGGGGDGIERAARQARGYDPAPIAPLGRSDSGVSFRIRAYGRNPAGSARAALEWEVKPAGIPFDLAGLERGEFLPCGPFVASGGSDLLEELVTGLMPDTRYRWRARIVTDSPYFPRSPWLTMPYNAASEMDLRTSASVASDVASPKGAAGTATVFLDARPNPFRLETALDLSFSLPASGPVLLTIHDVRGRKTATLLDENVEAGPHAVRWSGQRDGGRDAAPGVYFGRLEWSGQTVIRKIVLAE